MAQTLSSFDEALKIDYLPVIREQLNNEKILLNRIQRNERDVSGKQWQMTAHYKRNSGIGARADNVDLPTAGQQAYLNPYDVVTHNYGRINVTGPTIQASRTDKGAMTRAIESEIEGVTRDLQKDVNYQLFNDGTSRRCLVDGDPSTGTTLTVDSPGTNYLYDGMLIDVIDASTGAVEDDAVVIDTVDSSTEVTVSVALDAGIEDNSWVIADGSHDGAGVTVADSYEMMGIKGIVDDSTYVTTLHNLDRSSYAWWKCATHANDDNSGTNRDLTLDLVQQSLTAVRKVGLGKTKLILSDFDMQDAYAALLIADKRFVNTLELDGGFTAIAHGEIPWVADVDCPPNTIFFLDTDHLFLFQTSDWSWMEKDGAILSRVTDRDAYEAVLFWYSNLGTDAPGTQSFLRDVQ